MFECVCAFVCVCVCVFECVYLCMLEGVCVNVYALESVCVCALAQCTHTCVHIYVCALINLNSPHSPSLNP